MPRWKINTPRGCCRKAFVMGDIHGFLKAARRLPNMLYGIDFNELKQVSIHTRYTGEPVRSTCREYHFFTSEHRETGCTHEEFNAQN